MEQHFYSNGKLLLTAEYVVLDGATAIALPARLGQDLTVSPGSGKEIRWTSYDNQGQVWFEDRFGFEEIGNREYQEKEDSVRSRLLEILHEAWLKNPHLLEGDGHEISTRLTFNRHWGLGTSSTLINNIADWAGIDPYRLLHDSFGGSGYDIACARHDGPILFQLEAERPKVHRVDFRPSFADRLFLVYLNKKQSSKQAIAAYYNNRHDHPERLIASINKITEKVLEAPDLSSFAYQLEKHESLMSAVLEMHTVKEALFPDFDGLLKSLGGWGGDFILAACKHDPTEYFRERGFETVIPYAQLIL